MATTTAKPKGLSLHIGLNSVDPAGYGGWPGNLTACEFDANDMERVAKAQGFTPTKLLTKAATSTAVIAAIKGAAKKLVKGDTFFITYSGHGGQVPDKNGDEKESDGLDETWCLYDRQLVDDELFALWGEFAKGVRILMLSDSCHSGTASRAVETVFAGGPQIPIRDTGTIDFSAFRPKALPIENLGPAYEAQKKKYDKIQRSLPPASVAAVDATVVLISGCQDNQTSLDGQKNGLFTEKLLSVWNNGGFSGSLKAFHKAILAQMPFTQAPNYFVVGSKNTKFEASRPFSL